MFLIPLTRTLFTQLWESEMQEVTCHLLPHLVPNGPKLSLIPVTQCLTIFNPLSLIPIANLFLSAPTLVPESSHFPLCLDTYSVLLYPVSV